MKWVLYAEDEPDDVFFMERAFKRNETGARLVTVQHGGEAISYLAGKSPFGDRKKYPLPHLVLLDLKMPIMDGFDVLKWIRTTPAVASIPVVVLTSSGNETDKSRAAMLGANGYLIKAGQPEEMEEMVKVFQDYWLKHDHLSDEKRPPERMS
jgi:CheY-like chemotaxis protein